MIRVIIGIKFKDKGEDIVHLVARALVVVGAPVGGLGFRTESSSCGAGTRSSRCSCWRFGGLGLRVCLLAWALVVVDAPVGG